MPRKTQTFKVVGVAPIEVDGKTYYANDEFEAHEKDVAFFLQVGAVKPKS